MERVKEGEHKIFLKIRRETRKNSAGRKQPHTTNAQEREGKQGTGSRQPGCVRQCFEKD